MSDKASLPAIGWVSNKADGLPTTPLPHSVGRPSSAPSMELSNEDASELFRFTNPKLVSQKAKSQVVYCDAFNVKAQKETPCILKFFSSSAVSAYQREVAVYSSVTGSAELQQIVPSMMCSGAVTAAKYRNFLGKNLPTSLLRKSDRQVFVIVLSYIHNTNSISDAPEGLRLFLVRAALRSLCHLHAARITHGDVSVNNLLIHRANGFGYSPYWIDFSSSSVEASPASISHEWEKAVEYFSDLVHVSSAYSGSCR